MAALDPRINAFRPELAAKSLQGQVEAKRFVEGTPRRVIEAIAGLRRAPRSDAALDTQALYGESITVYETTDEGWAWGQLARDKYVGWLSANALGSPGAAPTHKVTAVRTLAFPAPDIKLPPVAALPFGADIVMARGDDKFVTTDTGWHLPARHLARTGANEGDFVAVAERFMGSPYLWGGKTAEGLDCSGLVQISLQACGMICPRDSDMQEAALGQPVPLGRLQRGDLIFWKGHVAIARDSTTLIHANAHHMAVAAEPAAEAIARIKKAGGEVTSVKRL
ncbi:MAG: C40 family peptidase [Pseudolabrys sp.]|nr:C40 family peptidase [Pseudolabrys sp.]